MNWFCGITRDSRKRTVAAAAPRAERHAALAAASGAVLVAWALAGQAVAQVPSARPVAPAIEDNSYFIDEAYNQGPGVVQHINTAPFSGPGRRDIGYSFTQEWPLGSQRHQASFALPYSRDAGADQRGFGDILLNYRYQVRGGNRIPHFREVE